MNKFTEMVEIFWMVMMLLSFTILTGLNLWVYLQ